MLLLSGLLAACQASEARVEDRLTTAFEETMFGLHGPSSDQPAQPDGMAGRLARWRSPVKVAIVKGATPENIETTQERLEKMAALSGLDIMLLPQGESGASLTISFEPEREFIINGNEQAVCYAHSEAGDDGIITNAEVHIGLVKEGEWRTSCLTHELLHALGWRGHTHSIRSAISYMHGEDEMTEWDEYLMRTLYDPRLKPGISKTDALPTVHVILHELLMAE